MPFEKGTLIYLDYTVRIKDTGEVFDTTIHDDAVQHSISDSDIIYEPMLVSIGDSWVLKGLDEELANTSVGDKLDIEIPPEKGFGERDPGKVRMLPLRKLGEDAEKISVGDTVDVDGRNGIVRFIGSGRVQIDFNHKYAGKTIVYSVNVLRSLDSEPDKIMGLTARHFRISADDVIFEMRDNDALEIEIPDEMLRDEDLHASKYLVQTDLFKFIPRFATIRFIETFENLGHARHAVRDEDADEHETGTGEDTAPSSHTPPPNPVDEPVDKERPSGTTQPS